MKQYKIYVVDDDNDDLEILNEAFQQSGCARDIQLFHTVEELFRTLNSTPAVLPDLIVLDHQAPGTKGGDAIGLLRSDRKYDSVALAVYSTYVSLNRQEALRQTGADACFNKGVTIQEVQDHVKTFCEVVDRRKKDFPG